MLPQLSKNEIIDREPTAHTSILRQLSTMPPKKAAKCQLHLASIHSSTENLRLPLRQVTPCLSCGTSVLPEDEIHNKHDHNDEENTADMEEVLRGCPGDNMSDVLGDNPSEPERTMQTEIA